MQFEVSDNFCTLLSDISSHLYFCITRTTFDNVLTHDATLDLELSDFKVDNDRSLYTIVM